MNRQKLLCLLLMCFGFSLVYAAAQTEPAAGPPTSAPATPPPPGETNTAAVPPSPNSTSQTKTATAVAPTTTAAALPDPKTPQEFFDRARQLSDLEASGIPFHLKATYVASGDTEFTGNGTYEEWWQSKDLWRTEATLGDYKYVEIQNGDKRMLYGSSDYVPLRLRQTPDAVLIRIAPDTGTASKWKLKHKKLNGVDLAVLSSEYECGEWKLKAKCAAQNYFTQGGVLRIRLQGSVEDLYNDFQPFQSRLIPRNIGVAGGEGAILTISIASLELLRPNETELKNDAPLPASLHSIAVPIHVKIAPPAEARTKILSWVQPVYPAEAKQQRIQGTVVMTAIIDETGKIREPYVIRSAGPLLDKSALDAVRHWKYIPVLVHGAPVDAETTISVVYTLRE